MNNAANERMSAGELQAVRERLGLTGDALAGILHVNPRTVRAWEAGRDPIPVRVRDEVAAVVAETDRVVDALIAELRGADDPAVHVYRTDEQLRAAHPEWGHLTARWWRQVVARAIVVVDGVTIVSSGY